MSEHILSGEDWTRFFGVLCRDDGLGDIYNAEEKLQLHEDAMQAALAQAEQRAVLAERARDSWHAAVSVENDHYQEQRIRADAAEAQVRTLRRFVRHHRSCPSSHGLGHMDPADAACTCGLDAALGDQVAPIDPPDPERRDEWRVVDDAGVVCCTEIDDLDDAHGTAEMLDRSSSPDRHHVERAVVTWVREPVRFPAPQGEGEPSVLVDDRGDTYVAEEDWMAHEEGT